MSEIIDTPTPKAATIAAAIAKLEAQRDATELIVESATEAHQQALIVDDEAAAKKAQSKVRAARAELAEIAETLRGLRARHEAAQHDEQVADGAAKVAELQEQYLALHAQRLAKIKKAHRGIVDGLMALAAVSPEGSSFAKQVYALVPGFGSFMGDMVFPDVGGITAQLQELEGEARSIASATGCSPLARHEVPSALARQEG